MSDVTLEEIKQNYRDALTSFQEYNTEYFPEAKRGALNYKFNTDIGDDSVRQIKSLSDKAIARGIGSDELKDIRVESLIFRARKGWTFSHIDTADFTKDDFKSVAEKIVDIGFKPVVSGTIDKMVTSFIANGGDKSELVGLTDSLMIVGQGSLARCISRFN